MPGARLWAERFPGKKLEDIPIEDHRIFLGEELVKTRRARFSFVRKEITKSQYLAILDRMIQICQEELTLIHHDTDYADIIFDVQNRWMEERTRIQRR